MISDFITPISEDGQQTWEVTFFFLMLFYYNVSTNAYCLAGSHLGRKEISKNQGGPLNNSVHEPIKKTESDPFLLVGVASRSFLCRS